MTSVETIYTIAYILVVLCLIAPPTEFVAAGLTIQNLLSQFLGSEQLNFAYYHIRRTAATLIFHSLLPFAYYCGLLLFSAQLQDSYWPPWDLGYYWRLYLVTSLIIPWCALALAFYWSRHGWGNHPMAQILKHHAPTGSNWQAVASSIDIEFRRIDKFSTGLPGRRLIVTDSWLIKTSTYSVHVAHQSDVHLNLVGADEHELSHESATGVQYINIMVGSVNEHVAAFKIRLLASEYSDLREKLHSPVRNARNVVIQQSLSDRFLEAFRQQVSRNRQYHKPPDMELEQCIGCMQTTANIKLQKLCDNLSEGDCVQCYCRPMWCLECMGKWFANRQIQSQPETWMASKSPCPTCRSRFCMLDVCFVV